MKVKIYIEGGGDADLQARNFRQGWKRFFEAADLSGRMPRVVRGGGRGQTFDKFQTAVEKAGPDDLPLLLVDSEDPVAKGDTAWRHLNKRDEWDKPAGAHDDQAFLMVQCMETWFLADLNSLKKFFGSDFREAPLRKWPDLEQVPKATVLDVLAQATDNCSKKYSKGSVSFDLLGKINPQVVRGACSHAEKLLARLGSVS